MHFFIYFLKEEEPCWASQCQAAGWLARLLAEITGGDVNKPILRVDNKFTVALIKNPMRWLMRVQQRR